MASGSFATNITNAGGELDGRYPRNLVVVWSSTSNVANNTSTINWTLKTGTSTNAYYYCSFNNIKLVINGTTVYSDASQGVNFYTQNHTIKTGTIKVAHNSDGKKNVAVSLAAGIYNFSVNSSYSGSITLDNIPRAATLTAAPDFNDEENPTISYSNPAGNNVSSLQACIGWTGADDIKYRDISKTGSSYTFSLTAAEREALRNACVTSNSMAIKFYIKTVISGNTYYSILTKTLTIINAEPIMSPAVEDVNTATTALTGNSNIFVKYRSNARTTTDAIAKKGATIVSKTITCGGATLRDDGTIAGVTSGTFIFTVTDSRGNTITETLEKPLVEYINLTCNLENDVPNANGEIKITAKGNYFKGSFGVADNTLLVQYRYKTKDGEYGEWVNIDVSPNKKSYNASITLTGLDYKETYVIQTRAKDKLSTVYSNEITISVIPLFDWGKEDLNVNVPVNVNGALSMGGIVLNDFVVEQGTSGKWIYRKWNSGIGECWATFGSTSLNIKNAWGTIYCNSWMGSSENMSAREYPFSFIEAPCVVATPIADAGNFWLTTNEENDTGTRLTHAPAYQCTRATSFEVANPKISYYVVGKWK